MRYPMEETAEKHKNIVREASRLFREKGFSGVSVPELMKQAGLTHGPFYNHFSSKEALMAEALEFAMGQSFNNLERYCGQPEGRKKYVEAYLSKEHRKNMGSGCPIAAMAVEVGRDERLQAPFTRSLKQVIEKMTSCFRWKSKSSARSECILAVSAMLGALVLARAVDDPSLAGEILREVKEGLSS